ncbi:MAG TPA: VOC family protein [Thermoleophilaceae bacterium]|jgi:catechol 2,3-dioxygenase-like lactoylglutathione lyase family enzyme
MSSTEASTAGSTDPTEPGTVDMKLEVVTLPVSDVDRSKDFYGRIGWRLDADLMLGEGMRTVQFTPPHSQCSIHFGTGLTKAAPGSADRLILAVEDIEAARNELIARGVDVSEVLDRRPPGADAEQGRSYFVFASFSDPDGNTWLMQEITTRLPGREWED